jgi:hypothetical protein
MSAERVFAGTYITEVEVREKGPRLGIMPQPGLCRMASWGLEFLRFGGVPLRHIPGTLEAIRWRTGTFQRN